MGLETYSEERPSSLIRLAIFQTEIIRGDAVGERATKSNKEDIHILCQEF